MRVRIDDIKDEGLALDSSENLSAFPELMEVAAGGDCEFVSPIETHLRLFRVGGMIEVEGTVEAVLRLSCSRCLESYQDNLKASFALTFTRETPEVTDEEGEEVEITAEEMGLIEFEGDEIDLRDVVQEQVIMALPIRPLCRSGCKGLCPQCGADLNQGACGCGSPDFNIKFAALKNFKIKKD